MAWTNETQPFGPNHAPLLSGLASDGSGTSVPLAVDPATGRVLTTSVVSFTPTNLSTVNTQNVNVTTAGTRVQLGTYTIASITIKAKATNTGTIYVGSSGVTSGNGFQLQAGDSVSFDMSNANVVWIDASVNGEGVTTLMVD